MRTIRNNCLPNVKVCKTMVVFFNVIFVKIFQKERNSLSNKNKVNMFKNISTRHSNMSCPKIEGVVAYSCEKKLASNAIP